LQKITRSLGQPKDH